MRWGSWVSAGRKGRRRRGVKARGQGRARRKDFKVLFAQGVLTPMIADSFLWGFFRLVGGGSGGLGSGVSGRVSPPGTHVLLILGVERVHHIRRGLGIVAALLEALHRVRLGLLHGHLPSHGCAQLWSMTVGPPAFHRRVWARFDADAREFRRSDATPGSFSSSERSSTVSGQEDGDARGLDRVVA